MTSAQNSHRPMNAMEAQRYVSGSYAEIASFLSEWSKGVVAVGDDGQIEYASYGGNEAIVPSAVVVVEYECPSQWPGARERRKWRRTSAVCHADQRRSPLPSYYVQEGMCEDCRLWKWYCWVEQEFGWDTYADLFGPKRPKSSW